MTKKDIRLVKTLMNDVFIRVKASGIEPGHFRWDETTVEECEGLSAHPTSFEAHKLVHIPSGFYYQFGPSHDHFSPGHQQRIQTKDISDASWQTRLQLVIYWLRELKEQLDAPDLWAELLQERQLSQIVSDPRTENTQFTPGEKEYVIRQLGEIKQRLIAQHQLQLQQAEAIEQGFQNIADAMNRFGKKDWIILTIGSLWTLAVGAAFAPEVARDMFHSFMRAVAPLFDIAMKLIE